MFKIYGQIPVSGYWNYSRTYSQVVCYVEYLLFNQKIYHFKNFLAEVTQWFQKICSVYMNPTVVKTTS